MSGFFITATGTDIGKTYVACALAYQLRKAGKQVQALKPVLAGFSNTRPEDSDAGQLLTSLGLPCDEAHLDAITPFRFREALSPHLAAEHEHKQIDPETLVNWCKHALEKDGITLVEGAGGVMVPLTWKYTIRDWMQALALPAILVTGSYLGTISHTLSAVEVLRHSGITLQAIVVNTSEGAEMLVNETVASLRQFVPEARHILPIKRVNGWQNAPDMLHILT